MYILCFKGLLVCVGGGKRVYVIYYGRDGYRTVAARERERVRGAEIKGPRLFYALMENKIYAVRVVYGRAAHICLVHKCLCV